MGKAKPGTGKQLNYFKLLEKLDICQDFFFEKKVVNFMTYDIGKIHAFMCIFWSTFIVYCPNRYFYA